MLAEETTIGRVCPQRRRKVDLAEAVYVCKICRKKSYTQRTALWRHEKYECGKEPRFQCRYCSFKSKQRTNVYSHIRARHPGEEIYFFDLNAD